MPSPTDLLADVQIFALLDDDERAALVPLLEAERFAKAEAIYHYGDPGDTIYIVRSGKAQHETVAKREDAKRQAKFGPRQVVLYPK